MTSTPAANGQLRVLVVDDNRDAADTLAAVLAIYGYQPHACYHGQAALDSVTTFRPDVALIDLAMPHMDGCELARRLRLLPEAVACVPICLTGNGDETSRRLTTAAGFAAHLVKPADPLELCELLNLLAREKGKGTGGSAQSDTMPPS